MTDSVTAAEPGTSPSASRRPWWPPALAGVLALALGLAVAEVIAGALGRAETPVVAVGEEFIDLTPSWLKDLAIDLFGTNDKTALLVGMAVVLVALGAAIGVLTARRRTAGIAAAAALLGVAALAVWSRPDSTGADLVPTIAAGVVALPVLSWLVGKAAQPPTVDDAQPAPRLTGPSRRSFLTAAGVTAGLAAAGGLIGRALGARRLGVEESRDDLAASIDLPRPDVPSGVDLVVDGAQPWRTPTQDFYRIDTALSVPLVRAEDWSLRVHGMVENEVELDYQGLVDLGLVDRWLTLNCVSNEVGGNLIGNALWTGVPIADVLALAVPAADADAVLSRSQDGWTAGTPLDVLTDGRDALFALGMNGGPLPVEHGFPVRMIVPGLYGYVSATKWVVELEVSRFDDFEAYWTTRGWAERGPVKVASRIDVPRGSADVEAGTVAVAGVAWAQHRGIAAVQVRVDDGDWADARLADVPSSDTWRQWVWDWDAEPGEHRLQVRAVTADGEVQTGDEAQPVPDGATGWHTVTVDVG
ncbi:molybdopterin-dependent oxidoreductase [Jiangella asiatica]|uniref:Oxidoreductase n=1 Tax=Jiangella asiatica TaxID=2530372 RepID=A0A4R5DDN3_9ACTN|nr:molybdopterin-dependent oxidoreductase [Jiangella asiatica]TDE11879.1 oxidoreductase [Jiangella asiatica]